MSDFGKDAQNQAIGYITGAFGIVAGLAWNNAITAFIEAIFPLKSDTIIAKFIYALLLTAVIVVLTRYLINVFADKQNSKKGEQAKE